MSRVHHPQLLENVFVVELATVIAAPSACAILADHGATIIKIERPGGDSFRSGRSMFQNDNRGKLSISLDLNLPKGMEILLKLIESADVFVTNLRQSALKKLKIDYEVLRKINSKLIYAMMTGYGLQGPDANSPGYDVGAFWARSGVMDISKSNDETNLPARYPGGNGDHTTSLSLVAAILGGLFYKQRYGHGQLVETNLFMNGIWTLATPITAYTGLKSSQFRSSRSYSYNPCLNNYTCKDGKMIQMLGQQPMRHFDNMMRALGIFDMVNNSKIDLKRWVKGEVKGDELKKARIDLIALCDKSFLKHTREEWAKIFDENDVWYERVQSYEEVISDVSNKTTNTN